MTYSSATHDFSGIQIDSFVTEDKQAYVTLSSIAEGLKVSYDAVEGWTRKGDTKSKGIPVTVGQFKKAATAYPVRVILDFLEYRVSLGDKQALAFVLASAGVDMTQAIMGANLVPFSAAQGEVTRVGLRMDLITKWVAGYDTNPAMKAAYHTEATKAEKEIVACHVTIARLETTIERMWVEGKGHPLAMQVIKDYEAQIVHTKARLEAQGVSC